MIYKGEKCTKHEEYLRSDPHEWSRVNLEKDFLFLPKKIRLELKQIEQKTNELREDYLVSDHLKKNPITEYTVETNRELTKKYGQIFSAQVFKHYTESNKENQEFLKNVLALADMKESHNLAETPLASLKGKVKFVVSFGLGWEERYRKTVPYYVEDFLHDIKSLGPEVYFIKKSPFGTVADNIASTIPELKKSLESGEDIIFVSLCKGTPELLAAEAEIKRLKEDKQGAKGKILGHINLSGMLSGAIFSDFAEEIFLPKVVAPLMKLIPFAGIRDNAKMVDALEYMKTSIIEETLANATPHLDQDIFYVNITGAPMGLQLLENKSPMKTVIKYNIRNAFIDSANDGFLELPSTLIPESISKNQVTLVLDSSHMLADGELYGHKMADQKTRRSLYFSVAKEILKRDPQYAAGLSSK